MISIKIGIVYYRGVIKKKKGGKIMKKIFSVLFFVFIGFLVTPSTASANEIEGYDGVLNDGTYFNYGEEVITSEFSDNGELESVIIESSPINNNLLENNDTGITPYRIDNGTWIGRAYWITRDGVKSISIYPNISKSGFTGAKAWTELKANFKGYADWKNETVLKKQFDCHVRYGKLKIPWNIEPSKTSINPITCN